VTAEARSAHRFTSLILKGGPLVDRNDLVARHIDACRTLLDVQAIVCLIAFERNGQLEFICPSEIAESVRQLLGSVDWSEELR